MTGLTQLFCAPVLVLFLIVLHRSCCKEEANIVDRCHNVQRQQEKKQALKNFFLLSRTHSLRRRVVHVIASQKEYIGLDTLDGILARLRNRGQPGCRRCV